MSNLLHCIEKKVLSKGDISFNEALSLWKYENLNELLESSNRIKNKYVKSSPNLCTIINAKSGKCGEDCKYCSQSKYYATNISKFNLINTEKIVQAAMENESLGANCFSIVTSGKSLMGKDFTDILKCIKILKKCTKLRICASLGLQSYEHLLMLKNAGLDFYHHNLQTSEEFFSNIITSHKFSDRVETIKNAQKAGLFVCSGGIINLGEDINDRINLALKLKSLNVKSIPLNILIPIKGTPLENKAPLSPHEILRSIAIFRFINFDANLIYAAGRETLGSLESLGFKAGISSVITGTCLTTSGHKFQRDIDLMKTANVL